MAMTDNPRFLIHGVRGGGHASQTDPDATRKYGNLTYCLEYRDAHGGIPFHTIFDAGSSIVNMLDEMADSARILMFFSHLHDDHIGGFRQFVESLYYMPYLKMSRESVFTNGGSRYFRSAKAAYARANSRYDIDIFAPRVSEALRVVSEEEGNVILRDGKTGAVVPTKTKGKHLLENLLVPPYSDGSVTIGGGIGGTDDELDLDGEEELLIDRNISCGWHTLHTLDKARDKKKPTQFDAVPGRSQVRYMEGYHPNKGDSMVFRVDGQTESGTEFSVGVVTDVSLENKEFAKDLEKFLTGCDLVTFDCFFPRNELSILRTTRILPITSHQITHPCYEDAVELCGRAGVKQVLATHFPPYLDDEGIDFLINKMQPLAKKAGIKFEGAYPGLQFDLETKELVHDPRRHKAGKSTGLPWLDNVIRQVREDIPEAADDLGDEIRQLVKRRTEALRRGKTSR